MQEPKCLEIDREKRKRLLRPMFWTFMFSSFGIPLISLLLLFCLPKDFYLKVAKSTPTSRSR